MEVLYLGKHSLSLSMKDNWWVGSTYIKNNTTKQWQNNKQ